MTSFEQNTILQPGERAEADDILKRAHEELGGLLSRFNEQFTELVPGAVGVSIRMRQMVRELHSLMQVMASAYDRVPDQLLLSIAELDAIYGVLSNARKRMGSHFVRTGNEWLLHEQFDLAIRIHLTMVRDRVVPLLENLQHPEKRISKANRTRKSNRS